MLLVSTLAALGDHEKAVHAAQRLAALGWDPAADAYNGACALAQCVPIVEKDAKLAEAKRRELAGSYTQEALAMLGQAISKGYKDVAHIRKDTDLDPMRSVPEFQKLLEALEKK